MNDELREPLAQHLEANGFGQAARFVRSGDLTLPEPILIERSPDAKRAYLEGWRAAVTWVLRCASDGLTRSRIEIMNDQILSLVESSLEEAA